MEVPFIRNLDSGMRRLGFLEVLVCDCIKKGEQVSDKYLGEKLWEWANKNQTKFLIILGRDRGIKNEVGKITEKTAPRYVKYATEIGFLTKGTEKQLTDYGRLFQSYRKNVFVIDKNLGQQILLLDALLMKDKIVFTKIVRKIAQSKNISKRELFDWFAKECIPELVKEIEKLEDEDLIRRLKDTRENYLGGRFEKKRGYDLIKHMLETRIENFSDLGIIEKTSEKNYKANAFTKILNQGFSRSSNLRKSLFNSVAKYFKSTKKATKTQLIKDYIAQYDKMAIGPIESVYLPTLHICLFIDGVMNRKILFEDSMIEDLEERLFKKHYGDVVFLRDRDGKLTHINIDVKVKNKMRKGKV